MTNAMGLRERRRIETRRLILAAAYTLFRRRGYDGTSVDEILAQARISKGSLYHHFPSKESIFAAIVAERGERCSEGMARAADPRATLHENVHSIVRASWDAMRADDDWPRLQMEFSLLASREAWAREAQAASYEQCRKLIAGFIEAGQRAGAVRRGIDPAAAAQLFMALSDGLLVQWQTDPDALDPDELIPPMADMVSRYLAATPPTDEDRRPANTVAGLDKP
ncbi:MAG: hypothetical protein C0506_15435 [Anaerolinea sp.]|nr:hypothetical protein [Anaerolinea sp.]